MAPFKPVNLASFVNGDGVIPDQLKNQILARSMLKKKSGKMEVDFLLKRIKLFIFLLLFLLLILLGCGGGSGNDGGSDAGIGTSTEGGLSGIINLVL